MAATKDRPTTYQIRVQGLLDAQWSAWIEGAEIAHEGDVTVLTCRLADQAALQGLLRRLYALGLALISVNPVEAQGHDPT
jgi:hypothetical protein